VALTLKVVVGFTTDEIARAFLSPEKTIAQRITRAKKTIEEERLPYEVPERAELPERLASVLAVGSAAPSSAAAITSARSQRAEPMSRQFSTPFVESAKASGLDPIAYLTEVATRAKESPGAVLLPADFSADKAAA
jgi:predicted RNA polymerase sigma factor